MCICCPTAVFQLFRSSNTGGGRCSTILRAGLDGAVRDGLIARNPAAQVAPPGVERREARHLDADDVAAVLRAAEASRYHPALVLIASTGLRHGECLALAWNRVDLDAGGAAGGGHPRTRGPAGWSMSEPKTDRARRTVPLSAGGGGDAAPAAHRAEGAAAGRRWPVDRLGAGVHHGARRPGGPAQPAAGDRGGREGGGCGRVSGCTRCASQCGGGLARGGRAHQGGGPSARAQQWISITGDVYGHTSDDTARAAVDGLAGRLGL